MQFILLDAAQPAGSGIGSLLLMGAVVIGFYFLMIRPQRKREKQTQDMRGNIEIGDEITTIGGIIGRVVSIKDDTVLFETGSDRTKIRILRGAVQEVKKLELEESASASSSAETK